MKIFCSGIGGIGLSAYASLMQEEGHHVIGSDRSKSEITAALERRGIEVTTMQDGTHIPRDCELFVYSEAIPENSPERKRSSALKIRQISYPQAVGEFSKDCDVIAVCGTHGKSSTTAMAARVLIEAGLDPTVIIGTKSKDLRCSNWRKGRSKLFLLEACEYRRSFLAYHPTIILLTNCDGDHFDYYTSVTDYQSAFTEFVKQMPKNGILMTHMNDPHCSEVAKRSGREMIDADRFPLINLAVPGAHMQHNGQLVLALADHLEIPQNQAMESLSGYSGSWRRMEVKGTFNKNVTVIDDYAHHPREISATLAAMREAYPGRRIICVFQPHTHDRTFKFYEEFTKSFTNADAVIIPNIYVARSDIETRKIDCEKFVKDIEKVSGVRTFLGKSLQETEKMLRTDILKPNDVLLCMGAGDITELATSLISLHSLPSQENSGIDR